MTCNTLLIGDTEYRIDAAYAAGARAFRNSTPFNCNPHNPLSDRYSQWDAGHCHEAEGFHDIDRVDVIEARLSGARFVAKEVVE